MFSLTKTRDQKNRQLHKQVFGPTIQKNWFLKT